MSLIKFAVNRPVTMIIMVSVLLILGFFTYSKLTVDLLPEMELPVAAIITSYGGAGPEEVESGVTKLLESALTTVSNVDTIQSISTAGQSIIIMMFKWGTDMDAAGIEIKDSIGYVEGFLPSGVEDPMVVKMDPTMMPIMQIGVSGEDLEQVQEIAEEVIEPRLSRIPEVASVIITGGQDREVKVEVDPVRLENYGLTLSQVAQVLQMENFNMSSGKVTRGDREYYVRNMQEFETVEDIRNVAILTPTGASLRLGDIATVTDGYKEMEQYTRVNHKEAVGIHIMKQTDANTVKTSELVRKELAKIQQERNLDFEVDVVYDAASYVQRSINSTIRMIFEGALLAVLVLFLFLRNMRSTLIIFTSIPLSIIATFIMMYFYGTTLNLITMGGLALGVGRIVDDSIVVFENIYRHRSLGLSPMEAAITGASEVGGAILAATMTFIAVFLPMVFVEGLASIVFSPMAMTISFAILCSLFVALTIIPLMSSRILNDQSMQRTRTGSGRIFDIMQGFGNWIDNLGERYKVLLQACLNHRRRVIIIVTLLMVASCAAIPLVGAEFLPTTDSGEISVSIETDKGSSLDDTDEIVRQVEARILDIPEVETVFTSVGSTGTMLMSMGGGSNNSTLYVKLCPKNERQRGVEIVAEEIRQKLAGLAGTKVAVSVMDATSSFGSSSPVVVRISGDDLDVLKELSTEVADIVRSTPGTREVTSSLTDGNPEVQIRIDRDRAAAYGLTPMQVASEIRSAMDGTVATRYKVEGEEIDVRVSYASGSYNDMDYLTNMTILTAQGAVVKLSQIATFELAQGPVQIIREDQVRKAEVSADLLNRDLNSVMTDIQARVAQMNLPAGYEISYGGENEEMMESFASLAIALLLAILLVYSVMAVQYESFFNPFVIMFSVPTCIIGVVFGLLVTGRAFSITAFIGVIMLVGIAVSNAIVYVDYLKQLRERGMERNAAIVEAGRVRLRPILMTAFTTILAMLPMAIGLGEGAELIAPLATVVIGGLLASTLITLVLVPVVYSIFDDWGRKISARFSKGSNTQGPDVSVS
ncbi:MAG TPA: efflux RND transporter permease subunit [Syntrophomonadaceae bacterium]|nr:efflux RND transporter permease subunit [Syntrophomonadaceae bacterium]